MASESSTTTTVPPSTTTTDPVETSTTSPGSTTTTVGDTSTTDPGSTTTSTTSTSVPDDSTPDLSTESLWEWPPPGVRLLPLPRISFPLYGAGAFGDTYLAPRDNGTRPHLGTDIFAPRGTPVVAAASGVIERVGEAPSSGLFVVVRHFNGWRSVYVHLNNDSPGTDNGLAYGFGPGVREGVRVSAGTVLGYVGDSGNAETTAPHLHFELQQPNGHKANPYPALRRAKRLQSIDYLPTVDYDLVATEHTGLIAHLDPGHGFNADISVVDEHLYVGTWGTEERCPGTGVKVIDVTDPGSPATTTSFADHTEFEGTAAASLWVGNVDATGRKARVGVVAITPCQSWAMGAFRGLAIYELDDPASPVLLAQVPFAEGSIGPTSLDARVIDGRLTLAVGVTGGFEPGGGDVSEVRIYDLSDPAVPQLVGFWHPVSELDPALAPPQESPEGPVSTLLWTADRQMAAGFESGAVVLFDFSGTTGLRFSGRLDPAPSEVGPLPVWSLDLVGDRHLVVNQAYPPTALQGIGANLTVVDLGTGDNDSSLALAPIEEELQSLEDDLTGVDTAYAAESVVASASFVTVIDVSADGEATEVGGFVPAPAPDPQWWWPDEDGESPMIWDVATRDGFAYVSDHNSGVWIFALPHTGPTPLPG